MNERQSAYRKMPVAVSGLPVVGVSAAAAWTSVYASDKAVGITAWVAVAVVGASAMIAAVRQPE